MAKKQYSKYKAMYLNKCFQNGETPIAGPIVSGIFFVNREINFDISSNFSFL